MTAYPAQPEVCLTAAQMRLMARLAKVLTTEQAEQFIGWMELVVVHGQGAVTVKVYRGHPRFVEGTFTDDLRV